jgi:hypothetical protein
MIVKIVPIFTKSINRYRPGVYTSTHAGSSGVMKENEAA